MNEVEINEVIARKIDSSRDELVSFLQNLVRINSVTPGPETRYDEVADYIKREMEKAGLEVVKEQNNVIGSYGLPDASPVFIFNGHMDTVELGDDWIISKPLSGEIIDGRVFGRGAGDNKSAVAMSLYAAKALRELAESKKISIKGRLIAAATNEEEVGGAPVNWLIQENILPTSTENACIVGDGLSHNNVIHPCAVVNGCIYGSVSVTGRSCHGDWPQYGSNAIYSMNKVINLLLEIQEEKFNQLKTKYPAHPGDDRDSPYIHIGQIQGGLRFNIVPSTCSVAVTINTIPEQNIERVREEIEREITDLAEKENFKVQCQFGVIKKPIIYHEGQYEKLLYCVSRATEFLYGEPKDVRRMAGVSDLTHFVNAGIPSILLGAQSPANFMHGGDESVSIEALMNAAKLFAITAHYFLQADQRVE